MKTFQTGNRTRLDNKDDIKAEYPVFVYGSLLTGLQNYPILVNAHAENPISMRPATLKGYKLLNLGYFPGMIKGEADDIVKGEFYPNIKIIGHLDRLEGYLKNNPSNSFYNRILTDVTLNNGEQVKAYVYVLNHDPQNVGFSTIEGGDWRSVASRF